MPVAIGIGSYTRLVQQCLKGSTIDPYLSIECDVFHEVHCMRTIKLHQLHCYCSLSSNTEVQGVAAIGVGRVEVSNTA